MNSVDVLEPDTNVSVTAEVATTLPGNTGEAAIGSNVVKNSEDYLRVEDEILKVGMDSEEGRRMTEALVGYRYENGMVSKYRTNRYDDEGMNLYMDLSRDLSKDSEARSRVRERKGEQFLQWWDNAGMEDKNLVIADGIGRSLVGNPVRGRVLLAEKNGLANEEDDGEIADFVRQQTIALDAKRSQDSADSLRAYEDMVSSISKQAELPGVEGERSEAYVKALQKLNKSYELANQAFAALDGDGLLGVQGLRTAGGAYIRSPEWYGKLSKLRKQDKVAYDLLLSSLSRKVDELGADSVVFLGMMGNAVSQTMLGAAESVGSSNLVPVGMSPTATLESGWKPPMTRTPDVWWNEDFSAIKNDLNAVANRTFSSGREGWFSSGFDEVGGMAGHTFSFFMGGGVFSFMNSFSQSYAKYNSEGNGRDTSAGVAFGEALGEWAVERITFGKLGKLVGGKSFEAVSKGLAVKAGNFPVIGRILKSQNVVVRFGTNATIGYLGEHGEEVVTPYAQWMLGNMFGGGNGMDLSDANDQMFEVLSPRLGSQIFGFSAVMSLFGMGVNRMQRGRYERAISKEARARSLDIAESPEAMSALGLTENEILEIRNTTSPDKKIKLLDGYASERESEMPGDASGGERGYLVFAPEQDIVQELMQEKAIDTYVADGKGNYRVTNRQTGEVLILDKETAFAQLSKEVNLLNVREQFNLSRAVATNEYVDSFAKRDKSIAWESMSKADTIQTLQVLSNKATMRIAELTKAGVKNAGSVVDSSVHSTLPLRNVAVLGSSAKSRLELELNRSPDNELSVKNAVFPALNVRLAATKKLIRFAKNEASVIDLIEEVAELYTKDQYAKGISPESIGKNLRLVQNELRGQNVRDWKLIEEEGEMTRQMVTEGMSKLVKAVAMATHNRGRMSEASRRFMAWAEALLEWVRDLVKAGAAFHNAAKAGKIDANFEKMVYEAVGVSLGDHLADQAEADLSTELENIDGGNMSVKASDYNHLSSLAQWRSSIIRDMKKDPDQQRVVDYIIKALTGKPNKDGLKNETSFISYREVNSKEVIHLKNLTGRDFTDFEWRFVETDIRHNYNTHKNDSKSRNPRKSGYRDILKSDIILAPFFIDHLFSSQISNYEISNWEKSSTSVEFNIITPFDERGLVFQIFEKKSRQNNFITSKSKTPTISFKTSWAKYSVGISPTQGGSKVPSASSNLGTIASDVNSDDANDFSINNDDDLNDKETLPDIDSGDFAIVRYKDHFYAPNGKRSNLSEEEYQAARSEEFKAMYGDWEAAAIQKFMNGSPVDSIEGKLFDEAGDASKKIIALISEWLSKECHGEFVRNPVLGDIRLSQRDIKDSWREGRISHRAEAFRLVPSIIRRGIIIGHIEDYKGKPGLNRLLVAAPVKIDEADYYGIAALQYNHNSKRLVFHDVYTHEKTLLKNASLDEQKRAQTLLSHGGSFREEGQRPVLDTSVEPVINVLRRHLFVNTEELSGKIDENGEPDKETVREFLSGNANDFSINYDVELDSYLEASRASAVREYWRVVKDRTEGEISELERIFAKTDGKSESVAILAKARGVIRAAINALPVESREKIQSYKELLDLCLSMVSDGKIDARSKLSEKDLAAINMKIDAHPELLSEWMDKTTAEMVIKVYKRCSQVINLQVRDDLIRDVSRMLREVEPEIDTETRKYKVGKLGANNTRFLREVIRPAIFSTEEDALSQIKGLEVDIAACFDDKGGLISGMEEQYHQLNREKMVWENYGAMGSSDVDRVMDTHKYVTDFLETSSYAWQEHLAKRRAKWMAMKDKLSRNLPIEATPAELHRASDPENKVNNGRLISIGRSMESSIDFLDTMGKAIGMKDTVEELRKKFVHAMSLIGVESVTRQRRFNDFLEGLLGTRNQGKINSFLLDWRKQGAFRGKEKLKPFEYQEIKLPIEKAIEIIESRKRNPFFGAGVYSDESIVMMTEAVNDWVSGKNKARKYITVQELTRLTEEGLPGMSKDNALNLLMLAQQRNYKNLMERKGYTPEVLLELEEFIGPQGQAMKEFLLKEYYREGEMLRPVYEDTYGIPFPNVKNYCPARFYVYDKVSDAELMQLLSKESAFATMRSDGFLSVRKQHDRNPDTTVGALGLFWQHCQMVDNWVYTSELVTDYKAVLSDVRMSQKMVVNIGKTDFYEFKAFLSNIQNAGVELASGFVQADKLMNSFAGNVASLALVGRVTTILNQSTALLNGLHGCDLSIAEWVGAMARVVSGKGAISVSDLFQSDLFSWRRDGYAYGNLIGMKKQLGGSWNMLERSSDKLLGLMGEMDALMNAVSFAAVYDHYFRQQMDLRDVGGVSISRDVAHKYAVNQVEEGLARAAQPIDWSQKSKYMANAKGISVMQFMYKGEVMKKLGLVASRFRSGQKLLGIRSWLLCGFSMQLVAYLVQNLCRDDERDDKDLLSYLPGVILGPINGVPLFGELLGVPINKALAALGSDYSVNVGGMGGFAFSYRDIERLFSEDKTTLDAVKNKSRGISASALILGALTKSGTIARGATMATAGVSNIVEFMVGLLDKLDVQDEAEDERERRAKEKKDWEKKNK